MNYRINPAEPENNERGREGVQTNQQANIIQRYHPVIQFVQKKLSRDNNNVEILLGCIPVLYFCITMKSSYFELRFIFENAAQGHGLLMHERNAVHDENNDLI